MKMFGEKSKRIVELEEQLADYEAVDPYLEDARKIHNKVAELAGTPHSSAVIANLAINIVEKDAIEAANNQLAAQYIEQHRAGLFRSIYETVEREEGENIAKATRELVYTDTPLRLQLIEQAKQQLWNEKMAEVVQAEITGQEAVVEREKQRLIALNQFDIKFAEEGRLDLKDPELCNLLKVGDTLDLHFEKGDKDPGTLVFTWNEDGEGQKDWVFTEVRDSSLITPTIYFARDEYRSPDGTLAPSDSKPSSIAMVNYARNNGKMIYEYDKLITGRQVAIINNPNAKTPGQPLRYARGSYAATNKPVRLIGCDFKTKELRFFNDTQQK